MPWVMRKTQYIVRRYRLPAAIRRGTPCAPSDLLVTTGSQQGFDLLLRVMVAPGDAVLVEQPAYPATLQALKLQQADVVTVPVDRHGLDVARLAALLEAGTPRRAPNAELARAIAFHRPACSCGRV